MPENNLMEFDGPRTPFESEWDSATELARSIFFTNAEDYENGARTWPMSLRDEARQDTFVMFHKGQAVSGIERLERDISIYGHQLRLGYIGSVCTHPDYRKLGLASNVLSATMKRFHEDNVDFVCISGNREMYRRAGSRFVGGLERFTIKDGLAGMGEYEVRRAEIGDIKILAMLNDHEPLFSKRPLSDYEIVLKYGYCVGRPVEFILITYYSMPVGYLLVTKLLERDNKKYRRVMEYAGNRQFIISGLSWLTQDLPEGGEIEIDIQKGDHILMRLLSYIGSKPTARPGTHCVIDFARTMNKLKPYFASYFPEEFVYSMQFSAGNERFTAWSGKDYLKIEGQTNLVWTLLGTPPDGQITNVEATGMMKDLLETCLPIPLPPLEMNMI
jgi:RimJ/RimL family protein N-acetyltransferase